MRALRMLRVASAIGLAAAVLAAGCGDDGDDEVNNNADRYDGTQAEVATVVDDYGNAAREGEWDDICDEIFSDDLRGNIADAAGQNCPSEVEENLPEGEFSVEIDSVDVGDDQATVAFTDQDDNQSVFHLERTDSSWRVTRITPVR